MNIQKTEKEWQTLLTQDEFRVCRKGETEASYSGVLLYNHMAGSYDCVCCGQALFSSDSKFESGCGWPSFDHSITSTAIRYLDDESYGMRRTEIRCANCDSHLGHVFTDGPKETTGERYCVNSISLRFVADPSSDLGIK